MAALQLYYKQTRRAASAITSAVKNSLIIAHGLLGNSNNWNTFSRLMMQKEESPFLPTDIFQFDMRNHGKSPHTARHTTMGMASDLEKFALDLAQANPKNKTVIMGHSMGGVALMHSLVRRKNEAYYKESTEDIEEEQEIRKAFVNVGDNPNGGPFYGPLCSNSNRPVVCGAIIVDITPIQSDATFRLSSISNTCTQMSRVDLSKVSRLADAEKQLVSVGMEDPAMRGYVLTNLNIDPNTHKASWRCNIDVLNRDVDSIMMPDATPLENEEIRYVDEVPILMIAGQNSPYYGSREKAEGEMGQFFDLSSGDFNIIALPGCDHYPHTQQAKLFVETVVPFLENCYKGE